MTTFAKRLADEHPDEVAISDEVTALGWADLGDVLNRVANRLMSRPQHHGQDQQTQAPGAVLGGCQVTRW